MRAAKTGIRGLIAITVIWILMSAFQWKVCFDSGLQPGSGSYGYFILAQAFHNVANICLLNVLPLLAMLLAFPLSCSWPKQPKNT